MLPGLFRLDCSFFLGEPWIRGLLARWYEAGDEQAIRTALFGPAGRGTRSFTTKQQDAARDSFIAFDVAQQCKDGKSRAEAYRSTQASLAEFKQAISVGTIRRVVELAEGKRRVATKDQNRDDE
jgi:hypothetical protein